MSNAIPRDPQAIALARLDRAALPQYLVRDQVMKLVAACRTNRNRLFVRVAFETGGRVSELVALCRFDVDLANRQIRLRTLKRRSDRRRKRSEVFRWIPVSHSLCVDLCVFLLELGKAERRRLKKMSQGQEVLTEVLANMEPEDSRLFPFTRQAAHKLIRKAGKRAGLVARGGRDVSPHILRHSFAMNCLTQGVPITVLKELLGHASISSTMVYLKTDPAQAREFLSKVQF